MDYYKIKTLQTMTEQTRKSTTRGLEALLKLVLGEITIEQAEKIIANMNVEESNNTTGI